MQSDEALEKILMLGKMKRMAEDEMVGQHHQFNGHEFEQTLGHSAGQKSLVGYSPWGHRVRHNSATEQQQTPQYYC